MENKDCNLHIMPSPISDEDITALFNGILKVIRKKSELDSRAQMLNLNLDNERLIKALNAKQAECNRLKNEIIFLKSQLGEYKN